MSRMYNVNRPPGGLTRVFAPTINLAMLTLSRTHRGLPLLTGLLLLTPACGDDGSGDSTDGGATAAGTTTAATADATTDDGTTAAPTTGDVPTTTGPTGDATTAETTGDTTGDTTGGTAPALLRLTILHNNDGESQLIDAGNGLEEFGGAARFVARHAELRAAASQPDDAERSYAALTLSSGDNFLAGPEFGVSLKKGPPFYDAMALDAIGYDAICLGNHDFDFGPDVLAEFIGGAAAPAPFLSANLDLDAEPMLAALRDQGRIARSHIVELGAHKIGIVGATTPMLPFISSPDDVVVDADVAGAVQAEVDALEAQGIDKIVLIAHLQSIEEDLALAPMLAGVDVMIAGGGDEVLANDGDLLVPGDEMEVYGSYPLMSENGIPIVTTKGNYRYVGRLVVDFDAKGEIAEILPESGMVRVAGGAQPDAIDPDPAVQKDIIDPLVAALAELDANVLATSEVPLDGVKANLRTKETNEGNLVADALLWQAKQLAAEFGVPAPNVALQNGGGIRNDSVLPAGPISELDTYDVLPFPNFVAVVPEVSPAQFKDLLENAVSRVEFVDGRFAQIAGFKFTYDPKLPPRQVDMMGVVTQEGQRVREVVLADNTAIVKNGAVVPGAPKVHVATINFLARGGDQYPFAPLMFTALGVSYQQALANFIVTALKGKITAAAYPEAGQGRITAL